MVKYGRKGVSDHPGIIPETEGAILFDVSPNCFRIKFLSYASEKLPDSDSDFSKWLPGLKPENKTHIDINFCQR